MNKERLKEILLDQKEVFSQPKQLIDRDIDLNKYIQTSQVVIISGVRRCGKSSLLYLIKEKMQLDEASYCYFNFDDERIVENVSILEDVYNMHLEIYGREPILFFDEIQNIDHWEKFINRVHEKGIKVFVTGSNAKLLSSEISTSLTGRNMVMEIFPFSFSEFLRFKEKSYNIRQLTSKNKALLIKDFNQYLENGGFPLIVKESNLEIINSYFQDILYRDIISRYKLIQMHEIKQIGLWFASNIGKLFSYATLQEISGVKSTSSIKNYLEYYQQSYLFFYLKKFDFSVKKQIMNPKKIYTIDPAIVHRLGFNFSQNKGRVLENIVYLELLRRGKDVFFYSGKNECDFVIKEGIKVSAAIQVSWILNNVNFKREINGLKEAMNTYDLKQGLLITAGSDEINQISDDSIQIIPIWKWLLEDESS